VPVEMDDDAASLRQRIHQAEWELLPEAVALWSTGRLRREGNRVRVLPAPEAAPV
jgi:folate-dependent phosphoribosylglycinamide formyltransferase PurN